MQHNIDGFMNSGSMVGDIIGNIGNIDIAPARPPKKESDADRQKKGKMFDYLSAKAAETTKAIESGTLNQVQANQIAQQYFNATHLSANEQMQKVKRMSPDKFLEQLKKSGYEYKEVPAKDVPATTIGSPDGMGGVPYAKIPAMKIPAHGEAVKIEVKPVASEVKPAVEESKFPTWGYVAIGVAVVAGAFYYFKIYKK